MNESKFTPGPWKAELQFNSLGLACITFCEERNQICEFHKSDTNVEANANLIAAAPDMYEVLDRFMNHVIEDPKVYLNQISYWKGQFRAALNQATGK